MTANDPGYGRAKNNPEPPNEAEQHGHDVADAEQREKTADALAATADEIDALAAAVDDDTADALQDATAVIRIAARCHRRGDRGVAEELHVNVFGSGGGLK